MAALKFTNEFAETDLQKAEMLNKYFASQSYVNDDNKVLHQLTDTLHDPLDPLDLLLSFLKTLKMFLITLMLISLVDQISWVHVFWKKGPQYLPHHILYCSTHPYNRGSSRPSGRMQMSHVYIKKTISPSPLNTEPFHFSAKLVKSWNVVCTKNYEAWTVVREYVLFSAT